MSSTFKTRFAPSPNGYLHLGHALSALTVWRAAYDAGGTALLRIDDIDQSRARDEFEEAIFADLHWLGLSWPQPVRKQSDHLKAYRAALQALTEKGLTYPCFCTRRDLKTDEYGHYAGTCRTLDAAAQTKHLNEGKKPAIRLNAARALATLPKPARYMDSGRMVSCGDQPLEDIILARRDIGGSYILSCGVDDAAQGITHVIRGQDIQAMTATQVLLQHILDLPTPVYVHHPLLTDANQQKLSKSKGSKSLRDLRAEGQSAAEVRARLGFS
ncbi:MAG: tRNA glutamyl-Q(34) synthetase GluQRS [Pseudomonadota bacterium]